MKECCCWRSYMLIIFFSGNVIVISVASRETLRSANVWCVLGRSMPGVGVLASAWSLLAMTLDRFLCIHWPLRYNRVISKKFAVIVITLLWIFSVSLSFAEVINARIDNINRTRRCGGLLVFTLTIQMVRLFIGLLLPCIAVIIIYMLIVRIARKQAVSMAAQTTFCHGNDNQYKNNATVVTKAAVVYLVICIVFLCGWLPFTVVRTLFMLCTDCNRLTLGYISVTAGSVALSSCAVNPWLHTMRNRVFRSAFMSLCWCCSNERQRRAVSPAPQTRLNSQENKLPEVTGSN